jgi:hypothetical protein
LIVPLTQSRSFDGRPRGRRCLAPLDVEKAAPSVNAEGAGAPANENVLSDVEIECLARALFEEQERLLPEGETWEEMDVCDRLFYQMSAEAVVIELKKLRGG